MGDVASLLGDWFNTIALYTLVRQLTGSSLALGLVFITKMLPLALASPVAGLITDRFNRRRLMIAADLARAAVVLGFMVVDEAAELPLLYTLIALQVIIGAVFLPAKSASIPNITSERELLTANALSAATWSSLLALGAALGGFATEALGVRAVFALDSATYLVSAFFIFRATIPQTTEPRKRERGLRLGHLVARAGRDILDGWRQLRRRPEVGRIALTKPAWGLGGSGLVYMLALVGEQVDPAAPAVGIGLLFAARGLGTGIGPVAARSLIPQERRWPVLIGLGIIASGLAYGATSFVPWGFGLMGLVLLAHAPSGANWVLSTVMLQSRTEDRYRGRVFATEWLMLTLVDTVGILAASLLLEGGVLELRSAIAWFAGIQGVSGTLWLLLVVPRERRYHMERT